MASTDPTPLTWTLRCKYHKTTVLIHAEPLTSLYTVKNIILKALQDTNSQGVPTGREIRPLPIDSQDIRLAKLLKDSDPSEGMWESLDGSPQGLESLDPDEANSAVAKEEARKYDEKTSIKEAKLKDGGVIAVQWVLDSDQAGCDVKWDVVFPSFDDAQDLEAEDENDDEDDTEMKTED